MKYRVTVTLRSACKSNAGYAVATAMARRTCVCRGLRRDGLAQPRICFHAVWDRALGTRDRFSFAAFFVLGKRIWPFMVVAVAAADIIVRGHDFPIAAQIFAPIIIGGGYAIALTTLANPKWRFDPALTPSATYSCSKQRP